MNTCWSLPMQCWRTTLFAIVLLLAALAPGTLLAADPDEDWIEHYMSMPGHSAVVTEIRSGYRISWSELPRFRGVKVKVQTDSGRIHHGRIEKVDGKTMVLRAELHGGYAEMALRRDQVASTELE